jgi:UDP-N-acetylmuramate dehydrogenase
MSLHTSFKIGGPADYLVTTHSVAELQAALECCRHGGAPYLILGRGTNLLVRDAGFRGVVVKLAGVFLATAFESAPGGGVVEAGAAVGLADLARECGRRGLAGLEFAIGIPGTLGGAIIMNAGAYGGEMKNVVESASFLVPEGRQAGAEGKPGKAAPPAGAGTAGRAGSVFAVAAADLGFGYRTSRPQREGWVAVSARLRLEAGDPAEIAGREEEFTLKRQARQPLDLPSAGSAFKRPPGGFAGTLIDQSGCRGLRVGDAQVSERHAGFIVNLGSATAADVLKLIETVRRVVHEKSGIWLEPEIKVVGEDRF